MTVTFVFLMFWAMLAVSGDTPAGRFLRLHMVELPIAALGRVTRGHVLVAMVMIGLGGLIAWHGGADGVRMMGMAVPDATAWLTTFEVGAYLDALATLAAGSALLGLRTARDFALRPPASSVRRSRPGYARPRCSRRRAVVAAANDDDDGAGLALAG